MGRGVNVRVSIDQLVFGKKTGVVAWSGIYLSPLLLLAPAQNFVFLELEASRSRQRRSNVPLGGWDEDVGARRECRDCLAV